MNKKFWSEFVDVVPKGNLPIYEIDKIKVCPEMIQELAKQFGMDGARAQYRSTRSYRGI